MAAEARADCSPGGGDGLRRKVYIQEHAGFWKKKYLEIGLSTGLAYDDHPHFGGTDGPSGRR